MKRNILHILWAAAVFQLALASCRQEVVYGETDGNDARPFVITVTDGGYASGTDGMEKTGSRVTENGYTTTFTAGDQCGLYIVRGGEIIYDNICLTATYDDFRGLIWQAPEGTNLGGGLSDEQYFLYYPYQKDMTDKVTVADAVTGDVAFFAPLISGWQPKADQSNYTNYTTSDLMTATGTVAYNDDELLLSFSMTHCMAMAVIEMPETVYKFEGQEPYTVFSATAEFNGNCKPRQMSDGSYSYLVNPVISDLGVILTGSYDDGNRKFTITPSITMAGIYKTYKVDGGYQETTLQVGDFYMKDGTLLCKDTQLSEEQKTDCVGIVFWIGDATATDPVLGKDFPQCTHGLVVSLNEAKDVAWQTRYNNTTIQSWAEKQAFYSSGGYKALNHNVTLDNEVNLGDIQGYNNTKILKEYDKSFSGYYPVTILDCFGTITNGVTLPDGKTSGWYLPSPKELVELHNVRFDVNLSLAAIGSNSLLSSMYPYWSSAENTNIQAWTVNPNDRLIHFSNKNLLRLVRLVFAF